MKPTPMERFSAITLVSAMSLSIVACSKPVETAASEPAPSTTVGTKIDDTVITATVKSALLADSDVKSVDVKVETRKGEVMLSGFVDSQIQIERATAVAKAVSGVKSIDNKMALKTADTTVGNKVDDIANRGSIRFVVRGSWQQREQFFNGSDPHHSFWQAPRETFDAARG